MVRRYVAFDIETAKDVPGVDFNWRAHRPLGIACAAALRCDVPEPILWHGKRDDGTPGERMASAEAKDLVRELASLTAEGYTLLTWNGLGFDFNVLAEESGCGDECKELALNHVDMMFHVFCDRGFPVALDRAAEALGIPGKPEGMSGMLAPRLWAQGRCQEVLDYVAQDARIALQIAHLCDKRRRFRWTTQRGKTSSMDLPRGWLTVAEAIRLPLPDTSWMDRAIPRQAFTSWVTGRKRRV
jgi:RNase_H superfamily